MSDRIVKAPHGYKHLTDLPLVFLAGSIEMGAAEEWQDRLSALILDLDKDVVVLNPRRDDWDSTWVQSIDNPMFREQVDWELDALDAADAVAMHFDPATKSPITLLELGLYASIEHSWGISSKVVVHCPEGFWRKGNVDIVCRRLSIPIAPSLERLAEVVASLARINHFERRAAADTEEEEG